MIRTAAVFGASVTALDIDHAKARGDANNDWVVTQRLIQTRWVRDHSDYLYKTYGGTRIPEPVRWRMTVQVRKNGSRTEVEMICQEQVEKDLVSANLEFTGSVYRWIDVPSSTSREQVLLEKILTAIENTDQEDEYDYDYAE